VRRIPTSMVLPMITAMPKETPRTWSSLPRLTAGVGPAGTTA
jgi:hypothetical protein